MESSDNTPSALDAIDTVAFKVGLKGYNVDEVDEFLERLSVETRQLKDQLQQQRQQLRQAAERINQLDAGRGTVSTGPVPPPPPIAARPVSSTGGPEQVAAMIAMAQQFIEHAQQEAEAKARELTVSAQERAREIVAEARSRAEDEVNRLNGLKQRLSEDVDTLARQLETERNRLGVALAEFSRWIEASLQVGGAARATNPAPTPPAPPLDATASPTRQVPSVSAERPSSAQVLNFEQPPRSS
jgi:DivIVA domain-containing protein